MANEQQKSVPAASGGQAPAPSQWRSLHDEVDRMMSGFFGGSFGRLPSRLFDYESLPRAGAFDAALTPRIDVSETEQAIELQAELPGMAEKDVDLVIQDHVLTIRGEKKLEKEEKKKNFHLVERQYGSFQRSFELPDFVDESKIAAKFDKGVLSVTLPKSAKAKEATRKIQIGKG